MRLRVGAYLDSKALAAATLTLPVAALAEVKTRIAQLVDRLVTLADDEVPEHTPLRVYQLALQLMPVSNELS